MNIGSDLVRPTTERICGRRSVIAYFKQNPESGRLGSAALELLQSEGQSPRIFSALGEEWVPSSAPPPRESAGYSDLPPAPGAQHQLHQLEAQLLGLAAVQQGLVARLERLEERLALRTPEPGNLAPVARPHAVVPLAERPAGHAVPVAAASPAEPQRRDAQREGASPLPPPSAPAAPVAAPASPAPASEEKEEPPEGLLIPPFGELARCIAMLIGNNVSAEEASPFTINKMTRDCYAASLLDDGGEHVGLIVMDIKATIFLGGTLMMLPQSQLEQQVKLAAPEEDSIAASAEVCNALAGPINACQPHRHVRVGAFEKLDFKSFTWASEPAQRCDLIDSFGGRIAVLARSF